MQEETFTSFLAGVLLTRRKISYLDLASEVARFEHVTGVQVTDYYGGELLSEVITFDSNVITLKNDYSGIISSGEDVLSYLNKLSSEYVKRYFNIHTNIPTIDRGKSRKKILREIMTRIFNSI